MSAWASNFVANIRAAGVAKPPYGVVMINENIASPGARRRLLRDRSPPTKVPNLANVYPNLQATPATTACVASSRPSASATARTW